MFIRERFEQMKVSNVATFFVCIHSAMRIGTVSVFAENEQIKFVLLASIYVIEMSCIIYLSLIFKIS